MRIAYVISAYKLPDQLVRLVRRLASPTASFAVHVDAKTAPDVQARMVERLRGVPSVAFLERHSCHWGGFGHVRATLKGIDHFVRGSADFDYLVLLTGQDYPLRHPRAIERFLAEAGGRSYLRHRPLPFEPWAGRGGLDRIERWHLVRRRLHVSLPLHRSLPAGLEPHGGAPYWCLARPEVEYVHAFVAAHPEVVRFFEHVFVPDELFFQTILACSPRRGLLVDEGIHHVDWSTTPAPAILTSADLDALLASDKLFARKFDVTVDARVLDLLDGRLDREPAVS